MSVKQLDHYNQFARVFQKYWSVGYIRFDDALDIFRHLHINVPTKFFLDVLNGKEYALEENRPGPVVTIEYRLYHRRSWLERPVYMTISVFYLFEWIMLAVLQEPKMQIEKFRSLQGDAKFHFMNAMLNLLDRRRLIELWGRHEEKSVAGKHATDVIVWDNWWTLETAAKKELHPRKFMSDILCIFPYEHFVSIYPESVRRRFRC